jgi:hypothetical protein
VDVKNKTMTIKVINGPNVFVKKYTIFPTTPKKVTIIAKPKDKTNATPEEKAVKSFSME